MPGTGVIFTITTSLSGSKRNAILAAFGCTLGILPHILAAILGLSAVLNTSAQVLKIIKIIGVLYLTYLGIGLIRSNDQIEIKGNSPVKSLKIVSKAILINLLNPKLTLFFFSFLPQFISPSIQRRGEIQMIILSLFFMGMTFIVFCLYGLMANLFKQLIMQSPQIMMKVQKAFGAILIGYAGKLAFEE